MRKLIILLENVGKGLTTKTLFELVLKLKAKWRKGDNSQHFKKIAVMSLILHQTFEVLCVC